jgi:hypothetical protein
MAIADTLGQVPFIRRRSKERVDEGGNGGTLGENDHESKQKEKNEHGHQPPQFPLPEKVEQLRSDGKASEQTSYELHGLTVFPAYSV